jgi:4-hydroxythreonine-4-phosphate dehydrogenase
MPHLLLTPGDPTSIGPEITVKALQQLGQLPPMQLTIIGSTSALEKSAKKLGVALPKNDSITYHDIADKKPGSVSYRALETAVELMAKKEADTLVTGPISKRYLHEAGYAFDGHTEILEHLAHRHFNAPDARAEMLFVYKNMRLLLLTRHIALKDVPTAIAAPGAVARPIKTLIAYLRHQLKISDPRIAILGLNPHAGEVGDAEEEKKYFFPVIHAVNAIGASRIDGPFAADGFFRGFKIDNTPYDAIIAPYHDQGLIPFKILAGYEAVNVTIGLPFLRTSVSHGTAEDIAGQGIANEASMLAAIHLALESQSASR